MGCTVSGGPGRAWRTRPGAVVPGKPAGVRPSVRGRTAVLSQATGWLRHREPRLVGITAGCGNRLYRSREPNGTIGPALLPGRGILGSLGVPDAGGTGRRSLRWRSRGARFLA